MDIEVTGDAVEQEQDVLLLTLERLLAIDATEVKGALDEASMLLIEALGADKVDAFLHDPATDTLVAVGTSNTPVGRRQRATGLDRLPLANGGRMVEVFQTGASYLTEHADRDPGIETGVTQALRIQSIIAVPLAVTGERRGVLQASSQQPAFFTERDVRFLEAVAHWVGMVAHHAELVERIAAEAVEQGRRLAADELITVLAHDLGNYLTPLKGRLDLLRRRATREGRQGDLQDIAAAAGTLERLRRLVADLLDVSRLEQGLFAVSPAPVDLAGLARETAAALRTAVTDIRVEAPEEVIADADPERIRQALENLLANAVKHSPAGAPVVVTVGMEARPDGRWATLTVADQGPGVSPDLLPRLFQRFGRGSNSSGLGLGLYLASKIAEAHGGTLIVDTTLGAGARFSLALPADAPDAATT